MGVSRTVFIESQETSHKKVFPSNINIAHLGTNMDKKGFWAEFSQTLTEPWRWVGAIFSSFWNNSVKKLTEGILLLNSGHTGYVFVSICSVLFILTVIISQGISVTIHSVWFLFAFVDIDNAITFTV